jgi:hypothetical protein
MKVHTLRSTLRAALGILFVLLIALTGHSQTFTISSNPKALTIHPGDSNIPITVSVAPNTYAGPINFTLTGLPSGITVSPLTLTAGSSGTINLSAGLNADQEAFPATDAGNPNASVNNVTVVGAAGTAKGTTTIALTVSLTNPSYMPTEVNLPIVRIDTSGTPVVRQNPKHISNQLVSTNSQGSSFRCEDGESTV